MSYFRDKKYVSRREKRASSVRKLKVFFVIAGLFLLVLLFKNRISIIDHLRTYFY